MTRGRGKCDGLPLMFTGLKCHQAWWDMDSDTASDCHSTLVGIQCQQHWPRTVNPQDMRHWPGQWTRKNKGTWSCRDRGVDYPRLSLNSQSWIPCSWRWGLLQTRICQAGQLSLRAKASDSISFGYPSLGSSYSRRRTRQGGYFGFWVWSSVVECGELILFTFLFLEEETTWLNPFEV